MEITLVGLVFVPAGILAFVLNKQVYLFILSASAGLLSTAAMTVDGTSFTPFHLLAIPAVITATMRWLGGYTVRHKALRTLTLFTTWSLLITVFGPLLFKGIAVLNPRGGIDAEVDAPSALTFTESMFAQSAYLGIGAGLVLYVSQQRHLSAGVLTPCFLFASIASVIALAPAAQNVIQSQFHNFATMMYSEWETRHRGTFSEPSNLAVFSIAALVYALWRLREDKVSSKLAAVVILVLATTNLYASSSGTAALSIVVLVFFLAAVHAYGFFFMGKKLPIGTVLVGLCIIVVLVAPNPLTNEISSIIWDKSDSTSFENRTASMFFSFDLMLQTFGLGVGLGGNRPSSLLALLLSCTGIVGTFLFVVFVWRALAPLWKMHEWQVVGATTLAILVCKVVSDPDLSTPLMWLCIALAVHAGVHGQSKGSTWSKPRAERSTPWPFRLKAASDKANPLPNQPKAYL